MSTTTNNPSLNFKFGLQTDLGKVSLTPGTIYVTTDERTMWVDLPVGNETKRFRLGDFISYKNKTELKNDYQNWNSSTLAYIEDTNTLAKFDGTKWVDINNFNLIQSLDNRVGYAETKGENGEIISATGLFKKIKDEEDRATAKEGALETSIGSLADRTTGLENKVGESKEASAGGNATGLYKLIEDEKTRATIAENDINNEIGDKGDNSGITATTLWAAIKEVAANAGSSSESVTSLIEAEAEARQRADEAEAKARADADEAFDNRIDILEGYVGIPGSEAAGDVAAVDPTGLFKIIYDEIERSATEDENLSASINSLNEAIGDIEKEIGAPGEKPTGLYGLIKAEEARAIEVEEALDKKISDINIEIGNPSESNGLDNTLWAAIETVSSNVAGSKSDLESSLASVKSELEGKITNEAAARGQAISEAINAEKKERDAAIKVAIEKEVEDRDAAILVETNARIAADEALRADLRDELNRSFAAADAMTFKGVINSIDELPTGIADAEGTRVLVNAGDTYKIGTIISSTPADHTGAWYVGDLIIAKADQGKEDTEYLGGWYHISSGFEDDYTSYFEVDESNNKIILRNSVEQDRGNISFKVPESGSDSLIVDVIADSENNKNAEVIINLVWGTF